MLDAGRGGVTVLFDHSIQSQFNTKFAALSITIFNAIFDYFISLNVVDNISTLTDICLLKLFDRYHIELFPDIIQNPILL